MRNALWITGNLIAVIVGLLVAQRHGNAAGFFAWTVIAFLADIRRNTDAQHPTNGADKEQPQ